jgi:NTE family protein
MGFREKQLPEGTHNEKAGVHTRNMMKKPITRKSRTKSWRWGKRRHTYALALSGGAALGAYQVGALRAINDAGLDIRYIAGSSVGALNGLLAAIGKLDDLLAFWQNLDQRKLITVNSVTKLLFSGTPSILSDDMQRQIVEQFGHVESLRKSGIRFMCTAISLNSGELRYFQGSEAKTDKELQQFILASAAVPGVFPPVDIGGELFMDGGLVRNTPVEALEHCNVDKVIAIAMEPEQYPIEDVSTTAQIALRSVSIFFRQQATDAIQRARNSKIAKPRKFLMLRPKLPLEMQQYELDPKKIAKLLDQGYAEMVDFIKKEKLK